MELTPLEVAAVTDVASASHAARSGFRRRHASIDNLKVVLVTGVVVGHTTMAWTGVGDWVFREPPVREPLLSFLVLIAVIGALFAIPVFFFVAGMFTPASLERKGLGRFLVERLVRLGLPMLFFVIFLSPVVEYVDPGNAEWDRGFGPFILHIWWPPAPGPTWFLGVLFVFSAAYGVARTIWPRRPSGSAVSAPRSLATIVIAMAVTSYFVRMQVPLGVEFGRLALGQTPGWVAGFGLGVMAGERNWLERRPCSVSSLTRRLAWLGLVATAAFIGTAAATGADIDTYAGGGTWQSFLMAALEGSLVVGMSFWLVDVFDRRFAHQTGLVRELSRSSYAAFVVHQVVLVGLVLATRLTPLAPEIEYLAVCVLGVMLSFGLGALLVRIPSAGKVI